MDGFIMNSRSALWYLVNELMGMNQRGWNPFQDKTPFQHLDPYEKPRIPNQVGQQDVMATPHDGQPYYRGVTPGMNIRDEPFSFIPSQDEHYFMKNVPRSSRLNEPEKTLYFV